MTTNIGVTQSQTTVVVAIAPETSWGVVAPGPYRELERISWTLELDQDALESARIASDAQISDVRMGARMTKGSMDDELALSSSDAFLAASLRNVWSASPTFNGVVTTGAAPLNSITRTSGSFLADGFVPNMAVTLSGLSDTAADTLARILTVSDTTISVDVDLDAESGVAIEVSVIGKIVRNGILNPSFTAELKYSDLTPVQYQASVGVRVVGSTFTLEPSGLAKISYDLMGMDELLPSVTSVAGTVLPPLLGDLLASPDSKVFLNGVEIAIISNLELKTTQNAQNRKLVGRKAIGSITPGRHKITGTIEALLQDMSLINAFNAEEDMSLSIQLFAANGVDFDMIILPRIKLTSSTHDISGEQEVLVKSEFQALKHAIFGFTMMIQSSSATIQF